jgi:hypothetical protein
MAMDFKEQWDLDTALKIVQNKTVDSKLWAEAVEWLLLYGPPEVVSILLQASGHATEQVFPELTGEEYSGDGQVTFNVTRLAQALGLDEEEIRTIIRKREKSEKMVHFFDAGGSKTVH